MYFLSDSYQNTIIFREIVRVRCIAGMQFPRLDGVSVSQREEERQRGAANIKKIYFLDTYFRSKNGRKMLPVLYKLVQKNGQKKMQERYNIQIRQIFSHTVFTLRKKKSPKKRAFARRANY